MQLSPPGAHILVRPTKALCETPVPTGAAVPGPFQDIAGGLKIRMCAKNGQSRALVYLVGTFVGGAKQWEAACRSLVFLLRVAIVADGG